MSFDPERSYKSKVSVNTPYGIVGYGVVKTGAEWLSILIFEVSDSFFSLMFDEVEPENAIR